MVSYGWQLYVNVWCNNKYIFKKKLYVLNGTQKLFQCDQWTTTAQGVGSTQLLYFYFHKMFWTLKFHVYTNSSHCPIWGNSLKWTILWVFIGSHSSFRAWETIPCGPSSAASFGACTFTICWTIKEQISHDKPLIKFEQSCC